MKCSAGVTAPCTSWAGIHWRHEQWAPAYLHNTTSGTAVWQSLVLDGALDLIGLRASNRAEKLSYSMSFMPIPSGKFVDWHLVLPQRWGSEANRTSWQFGATSNRRTWMKGGTRSAIISANQSITLTSKIMQLLGLHSVTKTLDGPLSRMHLWLPKEEPN